MLIKLACVIKDELLASLPGVIAEEFSLDKEKVKTFLKSYLDNILSGGNRLKKKKGTTAFLVFSKETRADVTKEFKDSDLKGREKNTAIIREIGKRWKNLSKDEQAKWTEKAKIINDSDDKVNKDKVDIEPKKKVIKDNSDIEPERKVTKKKLVVSRNKEEKNWIVKNTNLVLKGSRGVDRIIIGKFLKGKTIPLDEKDIDICKSNDWAYEKEEDEEEPIHEFVPKDDLHDPEGIFTDDDEKVKNPTLILKGPGGVDRLIIGKFLKGKTIPLDEKDIDICKSNNWVII